MNLSKSDMRLAIGGGGHNGTYNGPGLSLGG